VYLKYGANNEAAIRDLQRISRPGMPCIRSAATRSAACKRLASNPHHPRGVMTAARRGAKVSAEKFSARSGTPVCSRTGDVLVVNGCSGTLSIWLRSERTRAMKG